MPNRSKLSTDTKEVRIQQRVMYEGHDQIQYLIDLLDRVARDNEICEDERLDTLEGLEQILDEVMTVNKYAEAIFRQPHINEREGQGETPRIYFEC